MRNTCTASLYIKFSYDVRAILRSDKFNLIFPEVKLSIDKSNLNGWNTNKSIQVGYFGSGVGGTIIGFGANMAITDDLYRGLEDALSDTINDRIIQWKEATHDSRFEKGCSRIDIGTRWSINDIIGRNIEQKIYDKSIIVPALDDQGKTFCDEVMSTEEYIQKRSRTEKSIWLAEYMQEPIDIKGRLFSDLKLVKELPGGIEGYIGYVDVADQGADFTACAILGVKGSDFYVVDYVFNKDNTDKTLPMITNLLDKYQVTYCRVESNSMGAMFSRHLQRMVKKTRILQVANSTKKETRIIMNSVFIQQRMIFFINGSNECELFIQNVQSYSKEGKNKNDDAPDCLAGLSIFAQSLFKHIA
jgi:predicted phage terminase large subunit-like protein